MPRHAVKTDRHDNESRWQHFPFLIAIRFHEGGTILKKSIPLEGAPFFFPKVRGEERSLTILCRLAGQTCLLTALPVMRLDLIHCTEQL